MNCTIDSYMNTFGLEETEVLLVVPPFSMLELPCIGLDILKTIADSVEVKTSILYANMLFARFIGVDLYRKISRGLLSMHTMLGERIFANAADASMPYLGKDFLKRHDENFDDVFLQLSSIEEITHVAETANEWCNALADEIVNRNFKIVGITTGHQQTNAAISLINRIKKRKKSIICVLGGSACDGDMAEGVQSLCSNADYIFSGESEVSWKVFLNEYKKGVLSRNKIIRSAFLSNLNEIIINESTYSDYFRQLNSTDVIKESDTSFLYESSRGCWWGEHHKCSFCGVNGWNKHYRYKSEQKVKNELTMLLDLYPKVRRIQMVDTLMPRQYLDRLIGSIKKDFPDVSLFYEQRSDLTFEQVVQLKRCGIHYTQVGIEALSTNLLKLVNKGVTAEQNIKFLRYAKSVGLLVGWNLLTEIPHDKLGDWENFLLLIPMIYHLNPPLLVRPLEIARFSPYYERPIEYGIKNITPNGVYSEIYSESVELDKIAWFFNADYSSDSKENEDLRHRIREKVQKWMDLWKRGRANIPALKITQKNSNYYLEDSRFGALAIERVTPSQAKIALFGPANDKQDYLDWGLRRRVLVFYEGTYLPLATAHPAIMNDLNYEH